jgi:hypothetical protein
MKSKAIVIGMLLAIFYSSSNAQFTTFQKTFGGSGNDWGISVQQTANGGYIIAGVTQSYGSGTQDAYLFSTNSAGGLLWTKTVGGNSIEGAISVQQTSDGGYIMGGVTQSYGAGLQDMFLMKNDASGGLQWSTTIGGTDYDFGNSVQQTSDGGYIIAGVVQSYGAGLADIYLMKTDASGTFQWDRAIGGADGDLGQSIQQTSDGGYIITGRTASFGQGGDDVYLVKTDASGNIEWTKTYGGSTDDEVGNCVKQTSDGGYIIAGTTGSFGAGLEDVYIIKTDATGTLLWANTYGGTDTEYGYYIQQTSDGGYIVVGDTYSFGAGNGDVYLLKIDVTGAVLWSKAYGGTDAEEGASVQQTSDGGYIVSGITASFGSGGIDAYLIKTDNLGNSGCNETSPATITGTGGATSSGGFSISGGAPGYTLASTSLGGVETTLCATVGINEDRTSANINIYPNPFSSSTTIHSDIDITNAELAIIDIYGKEVRKISIPENEISINRNNLSAGIYFYRIMKDQKIISSGKLAVE